ncbi:TonB-dependent siderophore receptor [Bordetella genomosp. 9]|uniref:TonB-dependent siderophore receptor n=1 Tax=Bordetella genomosp. 9 TaxID=1416803 RepID=A0A1W6Z541_9BORD|nr:TonB-dependent siderophore receptor [Bordetella genomosp. 9]ARP88406.1 TonB-dependent siderophore receptor [Bordetella genomosp. 9]
MSAFLCDVSPVSGPSLRLARAALSLALAGFAAGAPLFANAAEPASRANDAAGRAVYDIAAGDLTRVLTDYAAAAGVALSFDAGLTRGRSSPGLHGRYTLDQGFAAILSGSALHAMQQGPGVYTLRAQPAGTPPVAVMPEVQVMAQDGDPWGPVSGYIAQDSVTATKTDAPLLETPQSVSVVTRQQMDDQGAQTVSQALRYTAGVVPEARPGRYDYPNIRGFGTPGGADANFVGLMDGLRLPRGVYYIAPSIDPYMLERVEVLRGPASVLYGSMSPGGAVNLLSKRPVFDPQYELDLQYGSFDRKQAAFDFSGPVDETKTLAYRLTGLTRDASTQVDYTKDQRTSISPSLTWQPDADTRFTLLANYQHDPTAGAFNYLPALGTVNATGWGRLRTGFFDGDPDFDRSKRKQYSVGYEFEHRFNRTWTVRQNLRYMHAGYTYKSVYETGWENPEDPVVLTRATIATREAFDNIAVDNQLQATFDTGAWKHTALLGADYRHNYATATMGYGAAPSLNVLAPVYGQDIVTPPDATRTRQYLDQFGVYLQDRIRWGRWAFLAGVRNDWVDNRNTATTVDTGVTVRQPQSDDAFTYRVGATYLFDNGLAPYASYSTSFEPVTGTDFSGNPFKPTKGRQIEAGLKYQPDGLKSFFTASVFQITQTNVKTPDPDPEHLFASVQTGEIRSRGVELEAHAALTRDLDAIVAYTWLNAVNTKSNSAQDKWPFAVPRNVASAWLDYRLPANVLPGVSLGAGVRYVGSSFGNEQNTFKVSSYTLVDAAIRYDLGKLNARFSGADIAVNASNLFDRRFVASCWSDTSCFYGPRRSVVANLRLRW